MIELFSNPAAWISLVTLTLLEIVLGIDNIIFISILSSKLPAHQQQKARKL
ncbi:TerC family protein, partial [Pedobacter sp.]|uniref:TerC family protein n=1 Tax=Pedobacter sp. TaxID=1411316 RepID=UPI003D7FAD0B